MAVIQIIPDAEGEKYEICSIASSNQTADDLAGPGRLLGKLYGAIGRKVERGLGRTAERMGYGPRMTALRIKKTYEDSSVPLFIRRKRIRKDCKRLEKYIRSDVPSTQMQGLDYIIDIAIEDDHLRGILSSSTSRTIKSLRENPYRWCYMDAGLQRRTRKALVTLNDAKIRYLVDSLISAPVIPFGIGPILASELSNYLFNGDYSFLVLRHISRHVRSQDKIAKAMERFLSGLRKRLLSLEDHIEWPVLDDILQWIFRGAFEHHSPTYLMMSITIRYAEKLPKTLQAPRNWLADTESEDVTRLIRAHIHLRFLQRTKQALFSSDAMTYVHPSLHILRTRLEGRLDKAISALCHREIGRDRNGRMPQDQRIFRFLRENVDSFDANLRRRALTGIRIALSMDRYTRRGMLEALSSIEASKSPLYKQLIDETATTCGPKDCIIENCSVCKRNAGKPIRNSIRHCAGDGKVLHILTGICHGECGATEEHILQYNLGVVVELQIGLGEAFTSAGHYPLLGGFASDGAPLYLAEIRQKLTVFKLALPDGVRRDDVKIGVHQSNGNTTVVVPDSSYSLAILALKFDPSAYSSSKQICSMREQGVADMDPTGPFSWKFRRRLPDNSARRLNTSRGPNLWVEPWITSNENDNS